MDTILDYLIDNILGCIAIVISVASPYYAARQTRAAEAQLRRKTPVLEIRKSTMAIDWRASRNPEQPNEIPRLNGIYETELVIRNVEPACSLEVSEIKSIRASAPFIPLWDSHEDDGYGNKIAPRDLPIEKLANSAQLNITLSPFGSQRSEHLPRGDTREVTILSNQPIKPGTLKICWEWADGLKS